ncbi:unnamed protein product, partial [Sphagnum compactum]
MIDLHNQLFLFFVFSDDTNILCKSKGNDVTGRCIKQSECFKVRGDYRLSDGDLDLCGIDTENKPLVCCTSEKPIVLQERISLK